MQSANIFNKSSLDISCLSNKKSKILSIISPLTFAMSSYNKFSLYGSKLLSNSVINICLFSSLAISLSMSFSLYVSAILSIVSETLFNLSIVSLLFVKVLSLLTGKNFEVPTNSSISIFTDFGIASNAIDATSISLKRINSTVYPLETYAKTMFPTQNPSITPIFPNLFNKPAIIPEIAYAAIIIGSEPVIIPKVTPIVTPEVAPINIPFFHPNTKTINMLNIFLKDNPNIAKSPKQLTAIATRRLVPITSSIEKALFSLKSSKTGIEFINIL